MPPFTERGPDHQRSAEQIYKDMREINTELSQVMDAIGDAKARYIIREIPDPQTLTAILKSLKEKENFLHGRLRLLADEPNFHLTDATRFAKIYDLNAVYLYLSDMTI